MRIAALALVGAVAVLLSGCAPVAHPPATPKPGPTAVFASDADALKAAEKAYAAYLAASNAVAQSGWKSSDSYSKYESGAALKGDLASANNYSERGLRQVGLSTFDSMRIEELTSSAPTTVRTYLCLDVSDVDVVDSSGRSIVPAGRISRNPLEVTFVSDRHGLVKVSDSQPWSGPNFC